MTLLRFAALWRAESWIYDWRPNPHRLVPAALIRPGRQRQQLSAKGHTAGGSSPYMLPVLALRPNAEQDNRDVVWECLPGLSGCESAQQTIGCWSTGMLCGEIPAAHDQLNRESTGMEPEGERKCDTRVPGAAYTPDLLALIEVRFCWLREQGDPAATVFGSPCATFRLI
ncbi:hypothetical protein N657DRAFT_30086 [Parathielavia appendiculata]|uniref:Uncharacterized protein n=1 Tax=Parathielavia appendiculata TaxID=2587402 RepID=A0AAN6U9E7_9PEZI|nr:hypothetical protein N657DRAFT_30086 [Parathielavia appendiculata]